MRFVPLHNKGFVSLSLSLTPLHISLDDERCSSSGRSLREGLGLVLEDPGTVLSWTSGLRGVVPRTHNENEPRRSTFFVFMVIAHQIGLALIE